MGRLGGEFCQPQKSKKSPESALDKMLAGLVIASKHS